MRSCTIYFAWDGTEFDDENECIEYEEDVRNIFQKIDKCFTFCNGIEEIRWLSTDMEPEDIITELAKAYNSCDYLNVNEVWDDDVDCFISVCLGFTLPADEVGRYWFDRLQARWEKVS